MERERLAAEQSPARPRRTRGSLVARRPGPVPVAGWRASAPPRFPGASQPCSGSGPQTPGPATASAPIPCACQTRPGGVRSSAQDCTPRLNPAAPLGFLRCPCFGGDFLPGPLPLAMKVGVLSAADARHFFPLLFFSFGSQLTPPPPHTYTQTHLFLYFHFSYCFEKLELPRSWQRPVPLRPLSPAHCLCLPGDFLVPPNVLQTFWTLEKKWGRARAEKLSAVHGRFYFCPGKLECNLLCIFQ